MQLQTVIMAVTLRKYGSYGMQCKHVMFFSFFRHFVGYLLPFKEQTSKDGAGYAVPSATDGTRQHGERLSSKEVGGKNRCQACVLHAYLNGDGALLCRCKARQSACCPSQEIAQRVVTQHHSKGPKEESQSACHKIIVHGRAHATHNHRQTDNAHARHEALDRRERGATAEEIVERTAYRHRQNGDNEDVKEHAHGIDVYDLSRRKLHEQRRHKGREKSGSTGHAHRESHIAMTQIAHDVARHAAGTTAHKQYAEGKGGVKVPHMHKDISHAGHDYKLRTRSYEDVEGATGKNLKVVGGERLAHCEHDDAKDDGLRCAAHPVEGVRQEKGHHGNADDEQ